MKRILIVMLAVIGLVFMSLPIQADLNSEQVDAQSLPTNPTISLNVIGTTVNISWTADNADAYIFYMAPYPDASVIYEFNMGNKTSVSLNLPADCAALNLPITSAFYVAIKAVNNLGMTDWSNIDYFDLSKTPPTASRLTPSNQDTKTNFLDMIMIFVSIPAGTFTMGSPVDEPGRNDYENHEIQHQVTLTQGFYMQTTEVTQGQWKAVMGSNPSHFLSCGDDCPVENVYWDDAQAFITKMNQRGEGTYSLPTEAQWEYAARAGSTTAFANGDITDSGGGCEDDPKLDLMGWYCYNSDDKIHPVAQKQPNAWGLSDMHGNVEEWCEDIFDNYGDYPYPIGALTDPEGPLLGMGHVLRGGRWDAAAHRCRSSYRTTIIQVGIHSPRPLGGVRLVLSPANSHVVACPYSISPSSGNFSSSGDTKTVSVTALDSFCGWNVSNKLSWVSVSPVSGTGSGEVTINVNLNINTSSRSGSITIADKTYSITQDGSPEPTPPLGDTRPNSLGMTFVSIPAGTFTMGSPVDEPGRNDYENYEIQHQVTLTQGFYMQTTEVTQRQWNAVMGFNPSNFSTCGGNCPVETVSWNDAQAFITKMNQRGEGTYTLPTEAQWEYAARAGSTTAFANGGITELDDGYDPNLDVMGWYSYDSGSTTHPVAQKSPNSWGLYDMHGNVLEWCQDWYGDYPTSAVTDPEGPSLGSYRVIRGGSWRDFARYCRSASRSHIFLIWPGFRSHRSGLRLVLSPDQ